VIARTASELAGINRHSATMYYQKIRTMLAQEIEDETPFDGEVEVDESYFIGRWTQSYQRHPPSPCGLRRDWSKTFGTRPSAHSADTTASLPSNLTSSCRNVSLGLIMDQSTSN
jgi:hypothetical protein